MARHKPSSPLLPPFFLFLFFLLLPSPCFCPSLLGRLSCTRCSLDRPLVNRLGSHLCPEQLFFPDKTSLHPVYAFSFPLFPLVSRFLLKIIIDRAWKKNGTARNGDYFDPVPATTIRERTSRDLGFQISRLELIVIDTQRCIRYTFR